MKTFFLLLIAGSIFAQSDTPFVYVGNDKWETTTEYVRLFDEVLTAKEYNDSLIIELMTEIGMLKVAIDSLKRINFLSEDQLLQTNRIVGIREREIEFLTKSKNFRAEFRIGAGTGYDFTGDSKRPFYFLSAGSGLRLYEKFGADIDLAIPKQIIFKLNFIF